MAATFQMNMFQSESNDQQATQPPKATAMTEKKTKAPKQVEPDTAQPKIQAPPMPGNDLTVEEESKALSDWLNHHAHSYYNLDNPMTSDSNYDLVKQRLIKLESEHPAVRDLNSPTQRIGGIANSQFEQVEHETPMMSLDNCYNVEDFRTWHARTAATLKTNDFPMVVELKIDGLAISLAYRDGKLVRAATRGNGTTGEEVTHNVRTVRNIPLQILSNESESKNLEARGEIYLPIQTFNEINQQRETNGDYLYANPRNAAAGTVRQLDPKVASERGLRMWIYSMNSPDQSTGSHWEDMNSLSLMGMPINPERRLCTNVEEVVQYYQHMLEKRGDLAYEADGIVIKVDSLDQQSELGHTGQDPRWAIAWKFPSERAITIMTDIEISIGRYGKLTPVAVLEPTEIAGVTVQHASLHNDAYVRENDLRIGDEVIVERAGDVIPQVVGPTNTDQDRDLQTFVMPTECPSCQSKIAHDQDEAAHWCENEQCPSRLPEQLKHFVSKKAMDIDGMGEKWCNEIINAGLVKNVADLYSMEKNELLKIQRMGSKTADRMLDNIEKSKDQSLDRVLYSLSIFRLGKDISAIMSAKYNSIDEIASLSIEELVQVDTIADKRAQSIYNGFQSQRVKDTIEKMTSAGVMMSKQDPEPTPIDQSGAATNGEYNPKPWQGLTFVITGSLTDMSRTQAEYKVEMLGGTTKGSVTKSTNYLVYGTKPGSKYDKAVAMGTSKINDAKFQELLIEPEEIKNVT